MNATLWIIAGLLSAGFIASGVVKVIKPKDKLLASYAWTDNFSGASIKAIGVLEILAAVGLILPAALDIAPILVPIAATGLAVLMAGAFITHLRRRETQALATVVVLFALAAVVAWGRFGSQSFTG